MSNQNIASGDGADALALYDRSGLVREMRAAVRRFAEGQILPYDVAYSEAGDFPRELWRKMGDQGFLGMTAPQKHGGLGLGYLPHLVVAEEISRCSGSVGLSYIAHSNLCVNQITLNGNEKQKAEFLPALISGEKVGGLAMSEANAGSDVMSMQTRATKCHGGYRLNGTKLWITNGGTGDTFVVYAKTGGGDSLQDTRHKAQDIRHRAGGETLQDAPLKSQDSKKITAFLVSKGMEGFRPGQKLHKVGMRASETYELVFEDCFVPDANVLGGVDQGSKVLMGGLNYERLILAGGALGLARAAFEEALNYTTGRVQFGRPINSNQAIAFELAQMAAEIDRERAFAYGAAAMVDSKGKRAKHDKSLNRLCAEVFLTTAQAAERISSRAVELHGGNGYTTEYRVDWIWRDAKLYMIGGGTSDIRKLVIARELGLKLGR